VGILSLSDLDDLAIGKAGEYLVCADLILKGYTAFPSEQGLPYDIVADIDGKLIKVQVKTTRSPRPIPQRSVHVSGYIYHVKRRGSGGRGKYQDGVVDLFALVAIDAMSIGYFSPERTKQTMCFRRTLLRGTYKDELLEVRYAAVEADKESGMRNCDIVVKHGLDPAVVGRIFTRKPYLIGTPYLTDFTLEDALSLSPANDNLKKEIAA
jgi:hypothetical protein